MKWFPILGGYGVIPFEVIEPHREQAMKNHGQTLERLAERGGLDYDEMLSVLEDRNWSSSQCKDHYADIKVVEIVRKWNEEHK